MQTSKTSAISVRVDQETCDRINRLAASRDRPQDWLIEEAIASYLEREENRAAGWQELIDAWRGQQASGAQLPADTVCAWLYPWGEQDEPAAQ
jgi:predicted transcriptional regulator